MSGIILLVEDDPLLARATATMLTRHGWQPRLAADAAEALRILHTSPVKAVVCDLHLPGDSGLSVIRSAVAHPSAPRVVAVSGMVDNHFFLTVAQRAGAHASLSKPVSEVELLRALAE
jgi:CheY-like chemotaxis protein